MKNDSFGNRMKKYENVQRVYLTRRMSTIIRLDGKAFHSFTRHFQKPFDGVLMKTMWDTAQYLCENIMGCKIAYTQSDEITLLLTDYDNLDTEAWFDKNVQKISSVSAGMASAYFNKVFFDNACSWLCCINASNSVTDENLKYMNAYMHPKLAVFDSRVFNIPKEEVCNCFIWRQQDAIRNSIEMVGQNNFSPKQLQYKSQSDVKEMLLLCKGIDFVKDFNLSQQRGVCVIKETYNATDVESKILTAFFKSLKDKNVIDTKKQMSFVGQLQGKNIEDCINFIANNNFAEQYEKFRSRSTQSTKRTRWIVDREIPIFAEDRSYIARYI